MDHVLQTLPLCIKRALEFALEGRPQSRLSSDTVSKILSDALINLDNAIRSDFLKLFSGGTEDLDRMTDAQVQRVLEAPDGVNYRRAVRCTQGTAVILALTDPEKRNLWIANLGDCQAGT